MFSKVIDYIIINNKLKIIIIYLSGNYYNLLSWIPN